MLPPPSTVWLRRHWLVLATGLAASLPVIVSTVHAVRAGWLPLGDDAIISVRSLDVFSTHPPLLGQYSAASQVIGAPVLSPGPLLYWLLAIPVRLGRAGPIIAVAVVNTCCVVAVVALARRRGGHLFMFATGAAVAAMCGSLDAAILRDIWNPAAAVLPFTLLIFLAWSIACGEYRLLPVTALVASFTAQAQLTYVLPDLVLLAVALAFLVASRPSIPRRWIAATVLIAVVCWSLPLAEEAVHRPGNVERIVQVATSGKPTLGASAGWHSIARSVGVLPWWLKGPRATFTRVSEVVQAPGDLAIATACAFMLALAALAAAAFRIRRRDLAAAALMALGLLVSIGFVAASTPHVNGLFAVVTYTLWWASPAGMFAWLVLGFGVVALLVRRRLADALALRVVGLAAVLAIGLVVAGHGKPDRLESAFGPAGAVARQVSGPARGAGTVLVTGSPGEAATAIQSAIVYELRREGIPFVVASLPGIGTRYDPAKRRHDAVLEVHVGPLPPAAGRPIARAVLSNFPTDAPQPVPPIVVTLRPAAAR